jgi:riboflavin kinase / FMN adenylyltransferase
MKTFMINAQNVKEVQNQSISCVIALGYFDGVHLGHQEVIRTAKVEATKRGLPLAVMSFRPHPINVLSDGKRFVPQLTTICEKEQLLQQLGVDFFYLVDFTKEFATLTPQQFVLDYLLRLKVVHAVAGFDFSYGVRGCAQLSQIFEDSGRKITFTKVACVEFHGEKISSTAIRKRLLVGKVHEMPDFLGKHYSVKAYWDQQQLKLLEDTMLPHPGHYEVEIEQFGKRLSTVLNVEENNELCITNLPKHLLPGKLKITWLNNVHVSVREATII